MTVAFQPSFLPTSVGSLPHTDPVAACELIRRFLPEVPAWPQLPRRDTRESIYAQVSRGFPGVVRGDERLYVDRTRDLLPELEQLYERFLANDLDRVSFCAEDAAGFAHFRTLDFGAARAVKGHLIGPVSWGLTMTDQDRRAILYDEVLADALAKHLRLLAAWQERELRRLCPRTILFVDEPYLASFGSAYIAVERDQAIALLEETLGGLQGLKGVHCCGNTDWSLLLSTSIDILNFDAYNFAETLALYPQALKAFLGRGGLIAWGIVPVASDRQVIGASAEGLVARLEHALDLIASKGVAYEDLIAASLLTPACGLGTLSEAAAERALALLTQVSAQMRKKYGAAGE